MMQEEHRICSFSSARLTRSKIVKGQKYYTVRASKPAQIPSYTLAQKLVRAFFKLPGKHVVIVLVQQAVDGFGADQLSQFVKRR